MKRFYKNAAVEACDGGYCVTLDGRQVKTPMKDLLVMPSQMLAAAVAKEWQDQGDKILPETMPITKLANTAQDRVAARKSDVVDELVGFAGSDLLCYRADYPEMLVERQAQIWGPYLTWLNETHNVDLKVTTGIIHVAQSPAALDSVRAVIDAFDPYRLTALHAFTTGFGSVTLGLAAISGLDSLDVVWKAARLDNDFQEEQWGTDAEAVETAENLFADLQHAAQFLAYL